jgi:hypothetical protein
MIGQPAMGHRWDIDKEAACFNCHKGAIQHIEITPAAAMIACTNCMAERHYTIHKVEVPEQRSRFEDERLRYKFDIWNFAYVGWCVNCGNCVENEVNVDEMNIRTVCPECYYTRLYEFNMFSEPRSRR